METLHACYLGPCHCNLLTCSSPCRVIKGCTYVFHTAGPTDMATFPKDLAGRQRLVDEAVQSQLDIIQVRTTDFEPYFPFCLVS